MLVSASDLLLDDAASPWPGCGASRRSTGKRIVLYCAFGERSAMAVRAAQDAGLRRG
jgi:rhodanese-related sulfurtransferase